MCIFMFLIVRLDGSDQMGAELDQIWFVIYGDIFWAVVSGQLKV